MNVDAVSVSQVVVAAPRKAGGVAGAATPPRADSVELDSVELSGKATGHARVAQNIERKVERLIARAVGDAGTDSAAAGVLADSLRGIAAVNTADPANPSGVLRSIREAVEQYKAAGSEPPAPVTPAETDDAVPGTDVVPVADEVPVIDEVPLTGAPAADLSALRLATAYAPVGDASRFEWTV